MSLDTPYLAGAGGLKPEHAALGFGLPQLLLNVARLPCLQTATRRARRGIGSTGTRRPVLRRDQGEGRPAPHPNLIPTSLTVTQPIACTACLASIQRSTLLCVVVRG